MWTLADLPGIECCSVKTRGIVEELNVNNDCLNNTYYLTRLSRIVVTLSHSKNHQLPWAEKKKGF